MTAWEWWAEFDAKMDERDRMEEWAAQQSGKGGGFTKAEWAEARRKHKEKMANR